MSEFEYLVEWRIRNIPLPDREPKETYNSRIKSWVLASLGLGESTKEIYSFIEERKMATVKDLTSFFDEPEEKIQESLDKLYSIGIIENLGKAYYIGGSISASIVRKLIPRVTESLRMIASTESKTRVDSDYLVKMKGKAFGNVGDALPVIGEMVRKGSNNFVKVIGVKSISEETVEVEGPVVDVDYKNHSFIMISASGEKVVVGGKNSQGVDLRAHSIILRGEGYE